MPRVSQDPDKVRTKHCYHIFATKFYIVLSAFLLIELTDGTLLGSDTLWARSWSRISHANMDGFSVLILRILFTTDGVATCC